jgi:NifB/MoaA-like Fe-S oxidoreductase
MANKIIANTNKNPKKVRGKEKETVKADKYKTVEERKEIVAEVIAKLEETHLIGWDDKEEQHYSGFPGIEDLLVILREYVKPVLLSGFSGVIKVPELGRNVEYILPARKFVGHGIRLVSTDNKDYVV